MKRKPRMKWLQFANCPICGQPFEKLRVIRILSNEKKGKYTLWCKNKHKLETLYREF